MKDLIIKSKQGDKSALEEILRMFQPLINNTAISFYIYGYEDEDGVVTKANIIVNGELYKELSVKKGSITITNLNFEENEYRVQLIVEYKDENQKEYKLESSVLEYLHEEVQDNNNNSKKCGKKSAELVISLITLTRCPKLNFMKTLLFVIFLLNIIYNICYYFYWGGELYAYNT